MIFNNTVRMGSLQLIVFLMMMPAIRKMLVKMMVVIIMAVFRSVKEINKYKY